MTTTDDARAEFLRGARLKAEGHRLIAQGQDAMERGAWLAADAGTRKVDVAPLLDRWLTDEGVATDFPTRDALGVSEHSVLRWLAPRNRERVLPGDAR